MKNLLKEFIPPILLNMYRKLKNIFFKKSDKLKIIGPYKEYDENQDSHVWEEPYWFEDQIYKLNEIIKVKNNLNGFDDNYQIKDSSNSLDRFIFVLNSLVLKSEKFTVFDFAGGTGRVWYSIKDFVLNNEKLYWIVSESSSKIVKLGKEFALSNNIRAPRFIDIDKELQNEKFDLIYVCNSLHYIYDLNSLFDRLLKGNPKFIVLHRLLISTKDTVTFKQFFGEEKSTRCEFHSEKKLLSYFSDKGFSVMSNKVNIDERNALINHLPKNYEEFIGNKLAIDLYLTRLGEV